MCARCKQRQATTEVKFAVGKQVRSEGNVRYFEGPVLAVPVCGTCFNRFYDDAGGARTLWIVVVSMGVIAGIVGVIYFYVRTGIPVWDFSWLASTKANLAGKIVLTLLQVVVLVFLSLIIWGVVASICGFAGALLGLLIIAPIRFAQCWPYRKAPYLKAHPLYKKGQRRGYKEVFWSDREGNIIIEKTETVVVSYEY